MTRECEDLGVGKSGLCQESGGVRAVGSENDGDNCESEKVMGKGSVDEERALEGGEGAKAFCEDIADLLDGVGKGACVERVAVIVGKCFAFRVEEGKM